MKWINKNIKMISFVWFLIQGVLLLLNEIRCFIECKNAFTLEVFVISICLIVVSFLLFIKNKKIIVFLGIVLLLYSIVALFFLTLLFLIASPSSYWLGLFLLIPILSIILSVKLVWHYVW